MSQLTGTEAYAPKNQLNVYNPDEFAPLVTENSTSNELIELITDANTIQTQEISDNTTLYSAFDSQFVTYTPTWSPGTQVINTFYPIITGSPTLPSVIGTNYVCNIGGSFSALSGYFNYIQIRITDTVTSTVLVNLYQTANYVIDQTPAISLSKTFMFQGTGNPIAFDYLMNGNDGGNSIYAWVPEAFASTYGTYGVTTPSLTILSITK